MEIKKYIEHEHSTYIFLWEYCIAVDVEWWDRSPPNLVMIGVWFKSELCWCCWFEDTQDCNLKLWSAN